jgi:hypothetical protein
MQTFTITVTQDDADQAAEYAAMDLQHGEYTLGDLLGSIHARAIVTVTFDDHDGTDTPTVTMTGRDLLDQL